MMGSFVAIDIKTGLILIGWITSITVIWAGLRYKIKRIERSDKNQNNIMFEEKGGLNLVSNPVCLERRRSIHNIIERESGITADAIDRIDNLQENMYLIMGSMNIEPKKFIKKDRKKTLYQCSE